MKKIVQNGLADAISIIASGGELIGDKEATTRRNSLS